MYNEEVNVHCRKLQTCLNTPSASCNDLGALIILCDFQLHLQFHTQPGKQLLLCNSTLLLIL